MGTNVANLLFPLATEPIVQLGRIHLHIILFAGLVLFCGQVDQSNNKTRDCIRDAVLDAVLDAFGGLSCLLRSDSLHNQGLETWPHAGLSLFPARSLKLKVY